MTVRPAPALIDLPTYWSLPDAGQRACEALVDSAGLDAGFDHSDCFQIVVGKRSVWFWLYDRPPQVDGDDIVFHVERIGEP